MRTRIWFAASADELLTNRLRSVLSMVSVVVGIWAVTVTVAAGQMAQSAISQQVEMVAGRPATLQMTLTGTLSDRYRTLSPDVREQIDTRLHRYGVTSFSPVREYASFAAVGQLAIGIKVRGVEPALAQVRRFEILSGRWLRTTDTTMYGPILVLDSAAVEGLHLGTPDDAIGQRIELAADSPVAGLIVGVVQTPPGDGAEIYLPISALDQWARSASAAGSTYYLIHSDVNLVSDITEILKFEAPKLSPGVRAEVVRIDNADSFKTGVATLQLVLSLIAAISLAAGGLGIINLGLVTVKDRVREFGIRRAFGATQLDLFAMVLAESLLISSVAGVVGVTLAIATTMLLPQLTELFIPVPTSAQFPVIAAGIGSALAVAIGLVVGLVPAYRTTRLDVISAVRG